ncbi:MAG: Cna B-type domain-containing protein [Facklamia hominis]
MKFNIFKNKIKIAVTTVALFSSVTLSTIQAQETQPDSNEVHPPTSQVRSIEPKVNEAPPAAPADLNQPAAIEEEPNTTVTPQPSSSDANSSKESTSSTEELLTSELSSEVDPANQEDTRNLPQAEPASSDDVAVIEEAKTDSSVTELKESDPEKPESGQELAGPSKEEAQTILNRYKAADPSGMSKEEQHYLKQAMNDLDRLLKQAEPSEPLQKERYLKDLQEALNRLQSFQVTPATEEGKSSTLAAPKKEELLKHLNAVKDPAKLARLSADKVQEANQLILKAQALADQKQPNQVALHQMIEQLKAFEAQIPRAMTHKERNELVPELTQTDNLLREKIKASAPEDQKATYNQLANELQAKLAAAKSLNNLYGQAPTDEAVDAAIADLKAAQKAFQEFLKANPMSIESDYTVGDSDQEFNTYHNNQGMPQAKLDKDQYTVTNNAPIDLTLQLVSNKATGPVALVVELMKGDSNSPLTFSGIDLPGFSNHKIVSSDRSGSKVTLYYDDVASRFSTTRLVFNLLNGEFHDKAKLKMSLYQTKVDEEGRRILQGDPLASKELNFLITKSGYEDTAHVGPGADFGKPGSGNYSNPYDPDADSYGQKEKNVENPLDAGHVDQDGKVIDDKHTKTLDFLHQLVKDGKFIDPNLLVAGGADPMALNRVRVEVTIPESDGVKAQHILNKEGINFCEKDGKLILELEAKTLAGKSIYKSGGKLYVDGQAIGTVDTITDVLFTDKQGQLVYLDKEGKRHYVVKTEGNVLMKADGSKSAYQFQDNRLLKDGKLVAQLVGDYLVSLGEKPEDPVQYYVIENGELKAVNSDQKIRYQWIDDQLVSYEKSYKPLDDNMYVRTKEDGSKELLGNTQVLEGQYLYQGDRFYGKLLPQGDYVVDKDGHVLANATWQTRAVFDVTGKYLGQASDNGDGTYSYQGVTFSNIGSKDQPVWAASKPGQKVAWRFALSAGIDQDGYAIDQAQLKQTTADGSNIVVVDKLNRVLRSFTLAKKNGTYILTEITEDKPRQIQVADNLPDTIQVGEGQIYVGPGNQILDPKKITENAIKDYLVDEAGNLIAKSGLNLTKLANRFYTGLVKHFTLSKSSGSFYEVKDQDGKSTWNPLPDGVQQLAGLPEQWVKTDDGKVYIYRDGKVYDQAGTLIHSSSTIKAIVQKLCDGSEKIVQGDSIFDIINRTILKFKFPGFKTGNHVHHVYQTHWEASYYDPIEKINKSIFKDGQFNTFHTFRLRAAVVPNEFSKIPPAELSNPSKQMDFELFNLIYRRSGDRQRSNFLLQYLTQEALKTANPEQAKTLKANFKALTGYELGSKVLTTVEENKARELMDKYQKLTGKALSLNEKGDLDLKRELEWILNYNNQNTQFTYPDQYESQLIFHESNLDNRLTYNKLIFKAPEADLKDWELAALKAGRKFEVDQSLFGIDQVERLMLGVNPYIKRSDFIMMEAIVDIMNEYNKVKAGGVSNWLSIDKQTGRVMIDLFAKFYDKQGRSPMIDQFNRELGQLKEIFDPSNTQTSDMAAIEKALAEANLASAPKGSFCLHDIVMELTKRLPKENQAEAVQKLKADMTAYLNSIKLATDTKTPYNALNSVFNAFQIVFKKGVGVPAGQNRKVLVTTVIKPKVDIPYTDEYGQMLTNKDLLKSQILRGLYQKSKEKDGVFDKDKLNQAGLSEITTDKYDDLKDAELRVLFDYLARNLDSNKVKELVQKDTENKSAFDYIAKLGSDLAAEDLFEANGKIMADSKGNLINPNYVWNEKAKSYVNIKNFLGDQSERSKERIKLIVYYLHKDGYNRPFFANSGAEYVLGQDEEINPWKPGYSWKNKYCGIGWGHCVTETGEEPGQEGQPFEKARNKFSKKGSQVTITYTPESETSENNNKILKKTQTKGLLKAGDSVDFEIGIGLDMLDRKTREENGKIENLDKDWQLDEADRKRYGANGKGYYVLKDGYIFDVLPKDLAFDKDSKVKVLTQWQHLKHYDSITKTYDNANATMTEEQMRAFEKGIQTHYVTSLKTYYESLPLDSPLRRLMEKAGIHNLDQHGIVVQLPEFEVPNFNGKGADLFKVLVNGLKVKETTWGQKDNTGHFTSTPWAGGSTSHFNVGEGKTQANKYIRWYVPDNYDKKYGYDGSASEWYRGTAQLNFGQRYDYRLEYTYQALDTGKFGVGTQMRDLEITDLLPQKDNKNGVMPYLVGPVQIEQSAGAQFEIWYKVGDDWTTSPSDYRQVSGVRIKQVYGMGGINVGDSVRFILPMRVPSLTLRVDDKGKPVFDEAGKPIYDGFDRLDFDRLFAKNTYETNDGTKSNEVTFELDKKTFMHFYKIWQKENRKEDGSFEVENSANHSHGSIQIDIHQTTQDQLDSKVDPSITKNYAHAYLNYKNKWNGVVTDLPTEYKAWKIVTKEDGSQERSLEKHLSYTYQVEEKLNKLDGYAQSQKIETGEVKNGEAVVGKGYLIRNILNQITVEAHKKWVNGKAVRPRELELRLLQDGKVYDGGSRRQTLSQNTDEYRYTWSNLPVYQVDENGIVKRDDQGNFIRHNYTVVEINADGTELTKSIYKNGDHSFILEMTGNMYNGFKLTNTYLVPKTDIEAKKNWVGGDQVRQDVYFLLKRKVGDTIDDQFVQKPAKVSQSNKWKVNWKELDKTDIDGNVYVYFVKEVDKSGNPLTLPNFKKEEIGLEVTNTYESPKIDIKAKKTWVGGQQVRPKVYFKLFRKVGKNGQAESVGDILEVGTDPVKWTDLDKTNNKGQDYTYFVKEVDKSGNPLTLPNFKKEEKGLEVINTYVPDTIDITATKRWVNGKKLRQEVYFKLLRKVGKNGQAESVGDLKQVATTDPASVTWTQLAKTNDQGQDYIYFVKEVDHQGNELTLEHFDKFEDGLTVTNTFVIPKTQIEVTKQWKGGPSDHPTITIHLLQDGKIINSIQLSNGNVHYQWLDLPATDEDGNRYTYTVEEDEVQGYKKEISGDQTNGFMITNEYIPNIPPEEPPHTPEIPEEPEKPEEPKERKRVPQLPQTGENNLTGIPLLAALCLVIGGAVLIYKGRRK